MGHVQRVGRRHRAQAGGFALRLHSLHLAGPIALTLDPSRVTNDVPAPLLPPTRLTQFLE